MRVGYAIGMRSTNRPEVVVYKCGRAWVRRPAEALLYGDPNDAVSEAIRVGGFAPVEVTKVEYQECRPLDAKTNTVWVSSDSRQDREGRTLRDGAWTVS